MSEQSHSLIGRVLADKLRLESLLGEGAAGAVYRAHHMTLDKPVAIKVLHQTHASDPQLIRRFKAEARAASRLDHPNSVRVLDFGEDGPDKLLYIAMEFLDGESLQQLLEREPQLASWRIASIMAQVAAGLAVAHEQGVVHRDIKPANIMLLRQMGEEGVEQEIVKVCDFGLAKILDANPDEMSGGPLTKQGTIFGTPTYMSPEQANGHVVDGRADQYACGVIMYRMAAGRPPFMADTSTGVLMKHILDAPVPILEVAPHLDARLAAIVNRTLEKEPEARFDSLRAVVPILREVALDAPQGAVPMVRMPSSLVRGPAVGLPAGATQSPDLSDTYQPPEVSMAPATLSSAPPPIIQPASNKAPMLAAVMGSVALLAVGGLGTYVLVGPGSRAPVAIAEPVQPESPAAQPPTMQAPPSQVAAEPPKEEAPVMKTEPDPPAMRAEAPTTPASAKKPTKKPKRRPPTKTKPAEPKTPAKPPEPVPEVVKPPVTTPVVPTRSLKPKLQVPPTVAIRPKLQENLRPKGPAKLGGSFSFDVSLADMQVSGGLSARKTRVALERAMVEVKSCLRRLVDSKGVETSGSVRVKGRIVVRGRLRELKATGGISGASACVKDGLSRARMPRPDTGDADLSLTIRYSAKAQ